ncbi:hypothetical protein OAG92_04820 [Akkermansiaceae bacterium]|nr:hypothetical protein [Akkermansiaceae bacterium]MDB4801551.1 hypothetical protein [Akkermansiaceae bacterium]
MKGKGIATCLKCNIYSNPFEDLYLPKIKKGPNRDYKKSLVSAIASSKRLESTAQIAKFFENNQNFVANYNNDLNEAKRSFLQILNERKIDFVWGFNGRMDHTNIFFKTCKEEGVPFISFEYPWFGNGINLIANEDCLSLKVYHHLNQKFGHRPLTNDQCSLAFRYANNRFKKIMDVEWRDFSKLKSYRSESRYKILILPSSRSEFEGHDDYVSRWGHCTEGFKSVIDELGIHSSDVYIQFHPIWFQEINKIKGEHHVRFYAKWAKKNRFNILSSSEVFESKDLISKSDIILINGSSAALEAGLMGKKIINVDLNKYTYSGVTIDIFDKNELLNLKGRIGKHDTQNVRRSTLRFFYTIMFRINSLERDVIVESSTKVKFTRSDRLPLLEKYMEIATEGQFIINDKTFGEENEEGEDKFIEMIFNKESGREDPACDPSAWKSYNRTLNYFRSLFRKGDL